MGDALDDLKAFLEQLIDRDNFVDQADAERLLSVDMSSEILAQNIPQAKFVVLPNQKHNYFASDPATAHKVIRDFLSE